MKPDGQAFEAALAEIHGDRVSYTRGLFAQLRAMGIEQKQTAQDLGISPRMIRLYTGKNPARCPYPTLFALQVLVQARKDELHQKLLRAREKREARQRREAAA